tara:strand:+ start:105 stop:332 length:228 start_codon:yes stop_codon:yes gene_type:complete
MMARASRRVRTPLKLRAVLLSVAQPRPQPALRLGGALDGLLCCRELDREIVLRILVALVVGPPVCGQRLVTARCV